MKIIETHCNSILTRTSGYLKDVSSHSLNPYVGVDTVTLLAVKGVMLDLINGFCEDERGVNLLTSR